MAVGQVMGGDGAGLRDEVARVREQLFTMSRIGVALSSEQNITNLLELIVREARRFTRADAGSLYIRDGNELHFVVTQNDTLERRHNPPWDKGGFKGFKIPVSLESMAGFVAATGKILNIPDVYRLPSGSGFRLNRSFDEENDYRTQSMLLSPLRDVSGQVTGVLQLINATGYDGVVEPFDEEYEALIQSLASQAAVALRNAQLADRLKKAYLDTIHRLAVAAEYKDEDTAAHLHRMSNYSAIIARRYGLPEEDVEIIRFASPMHDVGKIGVPDGVLLKPGRLTNEEFAEIKKHPLIGGKILEGADEEPLKTSHVVAISHHEKWDGSGYPYGLVAEAIPLPGRIVAVADVFDALTSKRCYKDALPVDKALSIIEEGRGKHFDPDCVRAFFDSMDEILEIRDSYTD